MCNFSVLTGESAVVAAELGVDFCGMCLASCHLEALDKHVLHRIFRSMLTEGNLLFEPNLAKLLGTNVPKMPHLDTGKEETTTPRTKKPRLNPSSSPSPGASPAAAKAKTKAAKAKAKGGPEPTTEELVSLINNLKESENKKQKTDDDAEDAEDPEEDEEEEEEEEDGE